MSRLPRSGRSGLMRGETALACSRPRKRSSPPGASWHQLTRWRGPRESASALSFATSRPKMRCLKRWWSADLRRFVDEARVLEADDDAGRAFFTLVARAADQSAAKNAALSALADNGSGLAAETRPIMDEMRRIFVTLLSRAQAVGAVRTDVGVDEVVALLFGAARATEFTGWDRDVLGRMVEVICDGLRPQPPHEPAGASGQER